MTEEELMIDIVKIQEELGIAHFPTHSDLVKANRKELPSRITRLGGSNYLKEKYNIGSKIPQVKWNDEEIEQGILNVMKTLNIKTYPTNREMFMVFDGSSLCGKVCKTGGYKYWSKKLNIPLKDGDTVFGNEGEDFLNLIVGSKGYKIEKLSTICLYDFLINDFVRVDCKISHLYHGTSGNFYSYNLENNNHDCDLFIFIALDDDNNKRVMVVPQHILQGQKQVSVGEHKSKWHDYTDRFDFIDKYTEFYKALK